MSRYLAEALDQVSRADGVRGALLVSAEDGLVIAEAAMEGVEAAPVAALAASLAGRVVKVAETARVWMRGEYRVFRTETTRAAFAEFLPDAERADLLGNYYRRLTAPDPDIHLPAGAAWSRYESACSPARPHRHRPAPQRQPRPHRPRSHR